MTKWYQFSQRKAQREAESLAQASLIAQNAQRSIAKKSRRSYAGAANNRLTADWMATLTSADSEIRAALKTLRNRARELSRNNDYVRQFLRAVQNNVIGQGIPFQAQVKKAQGNELDSNINEKIEKAWNAWAKKENCHTSGKLCFSDIERLIIRSRAEAGEVLVRMITKPFGKSKIPFALEIIEADLLDDDYNGISVEGRQIRMGVELDEWSRPTHYYFKNQHPGDFYFPQVGSGNGHGHIRVPASEIIHLFKTERVGQTRGVTDLASTIMRLHHVQGYDEATVIQKRADACLMGFIESPQGEVIGDGVDEKGDSVTEFESGVIKTLAPGEHFTTPTMSKSTGEYDPFMRSQLRAMAAGVGASYETISRDYSQSNYSSSRLSLIDDRDNWRVDQAWVLENFHQPIFERWLEMAVLCGELSLPRYELVPEKYSAVRWMPRGWAWVDPQKEITASVMAIEKGLASRTGILAQSGEDFNELMDQVKREEDQIRKLGLVFNQSSSSGNNGKNNSNQDDMANNSTNPKQGLNNDN